MNSASYFHELVSGRQRGLTPALVRGMLAAVEPIYGWAIRRKNRRFDAGHQLPVRVAAPVISVGNLTLGGTGKTPLVLWLARWLRKQGRGVTLISRGYGGKSGGPNDEALELAAALPDVPQRQDRDRVRAAQAALAAHPGNVMLLDDAFQHRRIARDLDIVLIDALQPFGFERLLPRGLLREPVESLARAHVIGLSRADAVSLEQRTEIAAKVKQLAPEAIWLELSHHPVCLVNHSGQEEPMESVRGMPALAFCGIGNPAGFRHTLSQLGVSHVELRTFPDHCAYDERALSDLAAWAGGKPEIQRVLCTQKDLVKIHRNELAGVPLRAVRVELQIEVGQKELEGRLQQLIG